MVEEVVRDVRERRYGYSAYAALGALIGGSFAALEAYGSSQPGLCSPSLGRQASSLVPSWGRCSVPRCAIRDGFRPRS